MTDSIFTAPAKVNLQLHILGKTENGYHLLDSLVCFTAFGDTIKIRPSDRFAFEVTGPFAAQLERQTPQGQNLIEKAVRLFEEKTGVNVKSKITLEKNIPIGGGLGGGSTDTAATIKALSIFYGANAYPEEITSALGSDITVCLYAPRPVIMRGTGNDIIKDAPNLPPSLPPNLLPCPVLLVNPAKHCATPAVYKNLEMERFSSPVIWPGSFETPEALAEFLKTHTRNDLKDAAIKTESRIKDVLEEIENQEDCLLSRLSGSGATAFGLFRTKEDRAHAATQIKTTHPDWWVVETEIL